MTGLEPFLGAAALATWRRVEAEYDASFVALQEEANGQVAAARAQIPKVEGIKRTINQQGLDRILGNCLKAG
jgi:hypothetical protein